MLGVVTQQPEVKMSHCSKFPMVFSVITSLVVSFSSQACSSGENDDARGETLVGDPDTYDPQVPPSSAAEMTAWLDAFERNGWVDDWVCEADATEKAGGAAGIHVHGVNRVCNNQTLANATSLDASELPVDSAALKFVDRGIYVAVKVRASSDAGAGWFWYAPGGKPAGLGLAACTGCHAAAGTDADHPGLGDYVYFQVKN